jgi:hypothetical protein
MVMEKWRAEVAEALGDVSVLIGGPFERSTKADDRSSARRI